MDAHYDAQIGTVGGGSSPQAAHGGPARQFGSGAAGLGALAVRVGRCALPLLKKYALPLAKKLGKNLVTAAIPEIGQVIAGRKKIRTAAKDSVKKSISESLAVAQPSNKPAGAARRVSGPQRGRPAQKARPVPPERVALPRLGSVKKRHDGKALSAPAGTKIAGSRKRKNAASSVTSTKKNQRNAVGPKFFQTSNTISKLDDR